jgi:glutathione S-transferase
MARSGARDKRNNNINKRVEMLKLIAGDKNYSSWSMRPWLLLTAAGIAFEEETILLAEPDTKERIARVSPSGTVPVLIDGELAVHDSLAICEYLAEKFPDQAWWPEDAAMRAHARSVSAEMHSSFSSLRGRMPMNIRNRYPGKGMTPEAAADIARVAAIWSQCVQRSGGPYLFGASFGIADAMYGPVVFRFQTYGVALDGVAARYQQSMLAAPAMARLAQLAVAENHPQARYDSLYA